MSLASQGCVLLDPTIIDRTFGPPASSAGPSAPQRPIVYEVREPNTLIVDFHVYYSNPHVRPDDGGVARAVGEPAAARIGGMLAQMGYPAAFDAGYVARLQKRYSRAKRPLLVKRSWQAPASHRLVDHEVPLVDASFPVVTPQHLVSAFPVPAGYEHLAFVTLGIHDSPGGRMSSAKSLVDLTVTIVDRTGETELHEVLRASQATSHLRHAGYAWKAFEKLILRINKQALHRYGTLQPERS